MTANDELVQKLLAEAKAQSVPEDALDDAVYDAMQEGGLGKLNSLDDEDEQEEHIGDCDAQAASLNNQGMEEQIKFLLEGGMTETDLRYELGL